MTNDPMPVISPLKRLSSILKLEKREIGYIYFYAILAGLIQLSVPLGVQAIINFVLAGSMSTSMIILIAMVVIGVFFEGFLQIRQLRVIEKIQQRIFARYSLEFAWKIPKLDMQKVDQYYLPELVNRFFDTVVFQKSISRLLLEIPTAVIQLTFGLILLSLYANVFIVFSLIIVLLLFLILRVTASRGLATSLKESDYKYEVAAWLQEVARVFRSFHYASASNLPIDRTDRLVTKYVSARTEHFKVLLFQYWTLVTFKVLITAGMLIMGSILLVRNQLNIGQFVAAEIVILTVLAAIEKLIKSLDKVYDLLTSVEKLAKVTDKPLEPGGTLLLVGNQMSVQLKNVNFAYSRDKFVLENINFEVKAGQKVCIMGVDGAGKSSLANLLSGAFHHFEGGVFYNGIPLANYNPEKLRQNIGVMFHDQDIFQGTLIENLSLKSDKVSLQEISSLIEILGFEQIVQQFKNGFDEKLDPTGRKLAISYSTKILLMRALLGSPALLILEEPWHRLDPVSAIKVKEYLLNEIPHTTTFILTNDFEFANQCDQVIYLENGRIVEQGKPPLQQALFEN